MESEENVAFLGRLEKVRLAGALTWGELAGHLGISTSLLHAIRAGRKPVSIKMERRLRDAEAKAGISSAPVLGEQGTVGAHGRAPRVMRESSPTYSVHGAKVELKQLEWWAEIKRNWHRRHKEERDILTHFIKNSFAPTHGEAIIKWLEEKK